MNPSLVGPIITALAGFLGVVVGTALVPWIRGYFARKESARYLAIRVVCILDTFIDDCAEVASDFGDEDEHGCSVPQVSAPNAPTYPTDVDWKSIDYQLMYDLLALPAAVEKASQAVSNASQYADPPDYDGFFETRSYEYATLGLAAYDLTMRLRKKYRIKDLGRSEWDPVDTLKRELGKIQKRRKRREESWAEIEKATPPAPATETPSVPSSA